MEDEAPRSLGAPPALVSIRSRAQVDGSSMIPDAYWEHVCRVEMAGCYIGCPGIKAPGFRPPLTASFQVSPPTGGLARLQACDPVSPGPSRRRYLGALGPVELGPEEATSQGADSRRPMGCPGRLGSRRTCSFSRTSDGAAGQGGRVEDGRRRADLSAVPTPGRGDDGPAPRGGPDGLDRVPSPLGSRRRRAVGAGTPGMDPVTNPARAIVEASPPRRRRGGRAGDRPEIIRSSGRLPGYSRR